ncbi:MAG: hypothetical protein ACK47B_10315 [Armatimonadota bacterium]
MRRVGFAFGLVGLALAGTLASAQGSDLVVHEWGTFLSMQGADGVTLDGMYHEEHALPAFVHARSTDQLRIPSVLTKGETPVIYFYTPRAQRVKVNVRFPSGIWTQWYPEASFVGPQYVAAGSPENPRNGHLSWVVDLLPTAEKAPALPSAGKDALWNHSREVDAAYLRTRSLEKKDAVEHERFLFYRGLGQAELPLRMEHAAGGTLTWDANTPYPAADLFVLRVENGRGAFRYLPSLGPGASRSGVIPSMHDARPVEQFTASVAKALAERLTAAGLYAKEARAMANTWRSSYFHTEGIRVLYLLPRQWTDAYIPLELDPKPKELVRVMVGRLELLTPEREARADQAVRDLASSNSARRERAFAYLQDQGRYVEPVVRRVLRSSSDEQVRTLCRRLLHTGWVTSLRAAVHHAATGKRIDPTAGGKHARTYLRAQLASVLKEIGLDEEARQEAEPALQELRRMPAPAFESAAARQYLRAKARAIEGAGDDRATADAYETYVRYAAQVKTCGGCHDQEGPRTMAWFRDWWAGDKLAEYFARAGRTEAAIREREAALQRRPNDTASQMILAYLYARDGDRRRADQMWARIAPESPTRRVAER